MSSIFDAFLEVIWGADPLEYHGGFRALNYSSEAKFTSSFATDGEVGWSEVRAESCTKASNNAHSSVNVRFPNIDWDFLRSIYGWSIMQYQAWARGHLTIPGENPQTFILYTDNILEFWIDDQPYFGGDFYAARRAPLVLNLDPGVHRLDVRLYRDVRAMGGLGDANIRFTIEARVSTDVLRISEETAVLPDIVDGKLASNLGSVVVHNEGRDVVTVTGVESLDVCVSLSPFRKRVDGVRAKEKPQSCTQKIHVFHVIHSCKVEFKSSFVSRQRSRLPCTKMNRSTLLPVKVDL